MSSIYCSLWFTLLRMHWLMTGFTVYSAHIADCAHFAQNSVISPHSSLLSLVDRMPWDTKPTDLALSARQPVSVGFGPTEWNTGDSTAQKNPLLNWNYTSDLGWKLFYKNCMLYYLGPVQCHVPKLSAFLQGLLDGGKSPFMLRTNHDASLGARLLVRACLKGARHLCLPCSLKSPTWDHPCTLKTTYLLSISENVGELQTPPLHAFVMIPEWILGFCPTFYIIH